METPETPEPQESVFNLVLKFFTIPLAIVLISIGIFVFFGRLAYEKKGVEDYLTEMKTGSANRRWQAAYELSKRIGREKLTPEQQEKLAAEMVRVYEKEVSDDDPRLRRYVVLGLSGLASPSSFALFKEALGDKDADVKLYALWGLGTLKSPKGTEVILPYLSAEDPALRKMAAYTLGAIGNKAAVPALKKALDDEVKDVRWNAALALAQLRDPAGLPVMHELLDRATLDRIPQLSESQKLDVLQNAIRGVAMLKDSSARPLLENLLKTESNPALLEELLKALDTLR